jgi:hypothetical protein
MPTLSSPYGTNQLAKILHEPKVGKKYSMLK